LRRSAADLPRICFSAADLPCLVRGLALAAINGMAACTAAAGSGGGATGAGGAAAAGAGGAAAWIAGSSAAMEACKDSSNLHGRTECAERSEVQSGTSYARNVWPETPCFHAAAPRAAARAASCIQLASGT